MKSELYDNCTGVEVAPFPVNGSVTETNALPVGPRGPGDPGAP